MNIAFDPSVHLAYEAPKVRHSMEELGLEANSISKIGITEPFRLLTPEAVRALRGDVFNTEVLDGYVVTSAISSCQVRGMAPGSAKFIADLWRHPDTIKACSDAAGMDLIPIMDYELGHTNVQTSRTQIQETLSQLGPEPLPALIPSTDSDSESDSDDETPEKEPVVNWHNDSYPWVCVLMLSDTTGMKGGETAIECGDGSIKKVRGPELGYAVMLQGRYIRHVALNAFGAPERVTMVTSFRARDPTIRDDSVLTTIRPISQHDELYHQWSSYRLKLLAERFVRKADELEAQKRDFALQTKEHAYEPFDKESFKAWAKDQITYLQTTLDEIV